MVNYLPLFVHFPYGEEGADPTPVDQANLPANMPAGVTELYDVNRDVYWNGITRYIMFNTCCFTLSLHSFK